MTKSTTRLLIAIPLLVFCSATQADGKDRESAGKGTASEDVVLLDFETEETLAQNNTSHEASVVRVKDTPEGGGEFAVKTVADPAAGAGNFFGTGFHFPQTDLTQAKEISVWIKTDIESGFNLQIHSGKNGNSGVSVFPFSTIGSKDEWKQITAPIARFSKAPWANSKSDLSRISKIQVTAFGSGPYGGRSIILDNVIACGNHCQPVGLNPQKPAHGSKAIELARSANVPRPNPDAPNILLILTDDLGWRDLSCYGSDFYETPNIDRLASQGMRFTDAYAAATVCSPTRAAILTGKSPARLHLTDFLSGLVFPYAALKPPEWQRQFLPHEEVTLAEMLKQAGYETFYFGKWHLGGESHFPATQGFDHTLAETQHGWPGTYFYPWPMVRNLIGKPGDYLTDRLTDEVIRSLERSHERPFFTFLSYFTPHRPTQAKEEHIDKYKAKLKSKHVQRNPVNAGMIHSLDENVGRIMQSLDELNLAEDTLVIFASDNGGNHYADSPRKTNNAPLRDGKGAAYEGAYRVPLIVRWPGKVEAGSETDEPVTSADLFPTLQAVSGKNGFADQVLDGVSLLPLLLKQIPLKRQALYWHYPHYHHGGASPHGVIRKGAYRLVEHFDGTPAELYDIENDIGETVNLVNTWPEKANELLKDLLEWRREVGAQMPVLNPNYDPDRIHEAMFYHEWKDRQHNGNEE